MLNQVKRIWSGSEDLEFESEYNMEESARRIKYVILGTMYAAGSASEERVTFRRYTRFGNDALRPTFYGRFTRKNDKVVLIGRYGLYLPEKIFFCVWFGFGFIACVIMTSGVILQERSLGEVLGAALMLGALGVRL